MSQLNRDPAKSGRPPTLADLRDSGAIEQDADVVFMLHREDDEAAGAEIQLTVNVAKNRNGPTLSFPVAFHRPTMRFLNSRIGA